MEHFVGRRGLDLSLAEKGKMVSQQEARHRSHGRGTQQGGIRNIGADAGLPGEMC